MKRDKDFLQERINSLSHIDDGREKLVGNSSENAI